MPAFISVVQTLRGKMWRTFLGLEAVKQEGYYEKLVHQALGNRYSKRKVRALTTCHALAECAMTAFDAKAARKTAIDLH